MGLVTSLLSNSTPPHLQYSAPTDNLSDVTQLPLEPQKAYMTFVINLETDFDVENQLSSPLRNDNLIYICIKILHDMIDNHADVLCF